MLSVAVLVRNCQVSAASCLQSLLQTMRTLGLEKQVQYILIDDDSEPSRGVPDLFRQTRAATSSTVQIVHFKTHQHYAYGMGCAQSLARGDNFLFFSHDMIVPPACVRMLLQVAARDPTHGLIRCTSEHMDCAEDCVILPPKPCTTYAEVCAFSELNAAQIGLGVAPNPVFIGDAMLISRSVMDRIGVFDTRYFGFMADIDYGLRASRFGFKLLTAGGAWLHHEGGGHLKDTAAAGPEALAALNTTGWEALNRSYAAFQKKWGPPLPEKFQDFRSDQLEPLQTAQIPGLQEYQPPIPLDPAVCDVL